MYFQSTVNSYVFFCLSFPIIIDASHITQVREPEIKSKNNSFVTVSFENVFNITDFSKIRRVKFYERVSGQLPENSAEASVQYKEEKINDKGVVIQPLDQGKDLLAKIEPCKKYKNFVLTIYTMSDHFDSLPFRFSIILDRKDNWICYEHDSSITLSLENSINREFDECVDAIEFDDGLDRKVLSEGNNVDVKISASKEATLRIHHDGYVDNLLNVPIISCDLQSTSSDRFHSNSVAILLSMVIIVLVVVIIATITIYFIRRKNAQEKIVTTDVNPTYGDNDYGYYYAETQLTDTNYEYLSELNDNDETNRCEIKERNEVYYQKGRQ